MFALLRLKYFLLLFFFIVACYPTHQKADNELTTEADSFNLHFFIKSNEIDSLLSLALYKGDALAYNRLYFYHITNRIKIDILAYSLIMSNKYNNAEASFRIYQSFVIDNHLDIESTIDDFSKSFAIYYLLKSYEQKFGESIPIVETIFKDSEIPNSTIFFKEKINL
jgi:hypothetical protein